jgi:hypothetical protein
LYNGGAPVLYRQRQQPYLKYESGSVASRMAYDQQRRHQWQFLSARVGTVATCMSATATHPHGGDGIKMVLPNTLIDAADHPVRCVV